MRAKRRVRTLAEARVKGWKKVKITKATGSPPNLKGFDCSAIKIGEDCAMSESDKWLAEDMRAVIRCKGIMIRCVVLQCAINREPIEVAPECGEPWKRFVPGECAVTLEGIVPDGNAAVGR